jgi:capsular polysaccharide biosynthesis protein
MTSQRAPRRSGSFNKREQPPSEISPGKLILMMGVLAAAIAGAVVIVLLR